jgi:hypothetical protein
MYKIYHLRHCRDPTKDTLASYFEKFKNAMNVIDRIGGQVGAHIGIQLNILHIMGHDAFEDATEDKQELSYNRAKEEYMANVSIRSRSHQIRQTHCGIRE